MKALILNSGTGSRMGDLTNCHPKCMTELPGGETILSRQLRMIKEAGITDVVMTTGYFDNILVEYCQNINLGLHFKFIKNSNYSTTNYIYSIFCAKDCLNDDILLLHGDLVFEKKVLDDIINSESSCMAVSMSNPLPEKDFKSVIDDEGRIIKIGVEFFENAVSAQPLYKLNHQDWNIWLNKIVEYCQAGKTECYAENAFNEVSSQISLIPLDIKTLICNEIDTVNDLEKVSSALKEFHTRTVYMCFSTDMIHNGHISIINKARSLGRLIIGVLSDEAVASYKRFPLLAYEDRKALFQNITGVYKVIEQKTLSYKTVLEEYHPTFVVHGDDWCTGLQKPIRDEVLQTLDTYGGTLVEFPYTEEAKYEVLEKRAREELSLPDLRRSRLKKLISMKKTVTAIEAHSGLTGLIAEKTVVYQNGEARQFDAMWMSSLCDSTLRGKPDIELVDMTSRFRTVDEIMEVTTKPIIFDGDTGGMIEHFVYTVKTLERMGVSMLIIEDKTGLKKNSLFGTEVAQTQDTIENFSAKIAAGKRAQKSKDFMIVARIESLILEKGMEDALLRAFAFVKAGADGIMIHSRRKDPTEIFEFIEKFRVKYPVIPLIVVPTSFNSVTEEEFKDRGVNVIIYANQLTRMGFPAMQNAARLILENHRAKECDDICMPFKEIINLIPEED